MMAIWKLHSFSVSFCVFDLAQFFKKISLKPFKKAALLIRLMFPNYPQIAYVTTVHDQFKVLGVHAHTGIAKKHLAIVLHNEC